MAAVNNTTTTLAIRGNGNAIRSLRERSDNNNSRPEFKSLISEANKLTQHAAKHSEVMNKHSKGDGVTICGWVTSIAPPKPSAKDGKVYSQMCTVQIGNLLRSIQERREKDKDYFSPDNVLILKVKAHKDEPKGYAPPAGTEIFSLTSFGAFTISASPDMFSEVKENQIVMLQSTRAQRAKDSKVWLNTEVISVIHYIASRTQFNICMQNNMFSPRIDAPELTFDIENKGTYNDTQFYTFLVGPGDLTNSKTDPTLFTSVNFLVDPKFWKWNDQGTDKARTIFNITGVQKKSLQSDEFESVFLELAMFDSTKVFLFPDVNTWVNMAPKILPYLYFGVRTRISNKNTAGMVLNLDTGSEHSTMYKYKYNMSVVSCMFDPSENYKTIGLPISRKYAEQLHAAAISNRSDKNVGTPPRMPQDETDVVCVNTYHNWGYSFDALFPKNERITFHVINDSLNLNDTTIDRIEEFSRLNPEFGDSILQKDVYVTLPKRDPNAKYTLRESFSVDHTKSQNLTFAIFHDRMKRADDNPKQEEAFRYFLNGVVPEKLTRKSYNMSAPPHQQQQQQQQQRPSDRVEVLDENDKTTPMVTDNSNSRGKRAYQNTRNDRNDSDNVDSGNFKPIPNDDPLGAIDNDDSNLDDSEVFAQSSRHIADEPSKILKVNVPAPPIPKSRNNTNNNSSQEGKKQKTK